jgi:hypothetical protein
MQELQPPPVTRAAMTDTSQLRVSFDPAIATSPGVRTLYDYWLRLRGTRRFPAKAEIDLAAIAHLASGLILLEVFYDPLDFEYRIIGDDIASRLGNVKGRRVREVALLNVGVSAYANYCAVVEAGRPQFLEGLTDTAFPDDRPRLLSRVHCPLAADGQRIDHIISYATFLSCAPATASGRPRP